MRPMSVLIKPASDRCNMRCTYCFYDDVAERREIGNRGLMTVDTLEEIVKQVLTQATGHASIMFQGGELMLAGLEFFQELIRLEEKYNTKNLPIHHGIQTNGTLMTSQWAEFFHAHDFLVGVSLDGTKNVHDSLRPDAEGKGTFTKVLRATQLLESAAVDFNILTVVTKDTARSITSIYNFFKRNGFSFQQYIPCLDPLETPFGEQSYSMTPEAYGEFLIALFALYHRDFMRGEYVSVRYFDNLIQILRGYPVESCDMRGICSVQLVIEGDGSVYPCDFYALDQYYMGNVKDTLLTEMFQSPGAKTFLAQGDCRPEECESCRWYQLCRGGCRRHWEPIVENTPVHNYYCTSFQMFFDACYPRLIEIARKIPIG